MEPNIKNITKTESTEVVTPITENEVVESAVVSTVKDNYVEIIDKLLKDRSNRVYKNLVIKNIKYDDKDEYTRITLVVNGNIPAYVLDEKTGDYKKGLLPNIYISTFALSAIMKQNEDTAFLGDYFVEHPEIIPIVISGATINVVQTYVPAGVEYINPFTTKEEARVYVTQHDTIINNVYAVKLGKIGLKYVDKLMERSIDKLFKD